jgi:hypothetical protein
LHDDLLLVFLPNAGKVADTLDVELFQEFRRANARAFENLGRAERSAADNDPLTRLDDGLEGLSRVRAVARGNVRDADGLVSLEDDARHTRIRAEEEVVLDVHHAVHVRWKIKLKTTTVGRGRRSEPVAASLRRPVCLLMYFAQISEAWEVVRSGI